QSRRAAIVAGKSSDHSMTNSPTPSDFPGFSLSGKTVLLTGGAGLYGRGLAAQLAAAGAQLILASRDVAALEKVAAEERALGNRVSVHALDQGDEASIRQLRDWVLAEFSHI